MPCIIVDLDNCISDDEWRKAFIDYADMNIRSRFERYHSLAGKDRAGNVDIFTDCPSDIVILTSRPERFRAITEGWLERQGIRPRAVLMGRDGDERPSKYGKHQHVTETFPQLGIGLADIVCAYDDNPSIVVMYQALGIPSEIRAINGIYAAQ